jgi:hypothetical protein
MTLPPGLGMCVLIRRGGCPFAVKATHALAAGARVRPCARRAVRRCIDHLGMSPASNTTCKFETNPVSFAFCPSAGGDLREHRRGAL